jgi:hypothetical protein
MIFDIRLFKQTPSFWKQEYAYQKNDECGDATAQSEQWLNENFEKSVFSFLEHATDFYFFSI